MRRFLCLLALSASIAAPAAADSLMPTRLIRAGDIIAAADLSRGDTAHPGTITALDDAVGLEARVTLFPGRPLAPGDLSLPRVVRRNELVTLIYRRASLEIRTEGRSLNDGVAGDVVQVMNLDSRTRLSGVVDPSGQVIVSKGY